MGFSLFFNRLCYLTSAARKRRGDLPTQDDPVGMRHFENDSSTATRAVMRDQSRKNAHRQSLQCS